MMLQMFTFEGGKEVRTLVKESEPWFVGKDVCDVLQIKNHNDALQRLPDDERDGVGITDPMGRSQTVTVVNEPGLYRLIFKSRTKKAEVFKTWVFHEVLPKLRKDGFFMVGGKGEMTLPEWYVSMGLEVVEHGEIVDDLLECIEITSARMNYNIPTRRQKTGYVKFPVEILDAAKKQFFLRRKNRRKYLPEWKSDEVPVLTIELEAEERREVAE